MLHTYEAVYESGVIRLVDDIQLPEHTKVYVVVPEEIAKLGYRIRSPRLVHPQQAADFVKEVIEEDCDASV
jgi:predicted DNA-binding antitoxin AbrB/MazE fold protein